MTVQFLFLDLLHGGVYLAKVMYKHRVLTASSQSSSPTLRRARPSPVTIPANSAPVLQHYYELLFRTYGPQKWWPAQTRFEVIVGAILTQNTTWTNVERALKALRRNRLLSPVALRRISVAKLAPLIRSSGYFRQKARKLKEFAAFLQKHYAGSLSKMFRSSTSVLREQLLTVHGIGPETADSILLYAGKHPVFVVDAYTHRILQRHGLLHGKETYEEIRGLFESSLPLDAAIFNEFHALIVHLGKQFCRPKAPLCSACPLQCFLTHPIEGAR
jgi:endonuclease III related protein